MPILCMDKKKHKVISAVERGLISLRLWPEIEHGRSLAGSISVGGVWVIFCLVEDLHKALSADQRSSLLLQRPKSGTS